MSTINDLTASDVVTQPARPSTWIDGGDARDCRFEIPALGIAGEVTLLRNAAGFFARWGEDVSYWLSDDGWQGVARMGDTPAGQRRILECIEAACAARCHDAT